MNILNFGMKEYDSDKAKQLISLLKSRYKLKKKSDTPFKVLISTVLSQRTRDEITDRVSTRLFSKYKAPEDFIKLTDKRLQNLVKEIGFYKVKAKRIKEISRLLVEKFDSKVPSDIDSLLSFPGVGRKTANCVLVYGFGMSALPVDTHVHRIANRLGIVNTHTPEKTEEALTQIFPQEYWGWLNTVLVEFGKETCKPIKPLCEKCKLAHLCLYNMLHTPLSNFMP